jgi:hypothetical protein
MIDRNKFLLMIEENKTDDIIAIILSAIENPLTDKNALSELIELCEPYKDKFPRWDGIRKIYLNHIYGPFGK